MNPSGRLIGGYGWLPPAGVLLGLASAAEAVLRPERSVYLAVALLAGLFATVPLVLVRANAFLAATAVTLGTALTVALYGRPSVPGAMAVLAAWGAIAHSRVRRARARRADREASLREVERSLLEFTARGERARIAGELHDVVAHHISMISVQAETARLTTPGMPPEGARRLLAIGETARTALTEMRRLLGVLREDAGMATAARAPQPGMRELLGLVDQARDAGGARTRLIVHGRVVPLDPGVELTAYRLVQESLTNARKHAPGAAVDVEIQYLPDVLRLRVRDNGPGPAAGAAGHGLPGMRERVASVGGTLTTGPADTGGFLVEARLPAAVAE